MAFECHDRACYANSQSVNYTGLGFEMQVVVLCYHEAKVVAQWDC